MTEPCFMYGDLEDRDEPVMTVLLIGFQGQRRVMTGTREELWREYVRGDGGYGCNGIQPIGWEYWCPQPLLTPADDARAYFENERIS